MNLLGVVAILTLLQCILANESLRAGLQIPYDGSLNYGTGMEVTDKGEVVMKGMPFISDPAKIRGQGTVASDMTLVSVVASDKDYAKTMKVAADLSFEGYGAEAQANFGLNKNFKYQSQQVTFFAKRKIDLGFHGYYEMPHLSPNATEILRTLGAEEFEKIYGTHFIVGSIRGASMTALINSKSSSSSSAGGISADMRLSWSGIAASVDGSFSINKEEAERNALTFQDTQIFYSGQKLQTGITAVDMDGVRNDLLNFHNLVNIGHGLALVLRKYNTVPDYYETLALNMPTPLDNALAEFNEQIQDLMYQELMQLKIMINEFKESSATIRAKWIESGRLTEIFDTILDVKEASSTNNQAVILSKVGVADLIKAKYATDCYDFSGDWYDSQTNGLYKITQTGFRSSDEIRIVDPDGKESLGGCDQRNVVFPGLQKIGELQHGDYGYGIYFRDGGLWFQAGAEPLTGDWTWDKVCDVYIEQTGKFHKGSPKQCPFTAELWQGNYNMDQFNWNLDPAVQLTYFPELQVIEYYNHATTERRYITRRRTDVLEGHFIDKGRALKIWCYGSDIEIQFCCSDLAEEFGGPGAPGVVPKEDVSWNPTESNLEFWGHLAAFNPEDVSLRFTTGKYWSASREDRETLSGDYMQGNLKLRISQYDATVSIKPVLPSTGAHFGWGTEEIIADYTNAPVLDISYLGTWGLWLPAAKVIAINNGVIWRLVDYDLDGYWTCDHKLIRIYHGYKQMVIIAPHSTIGTIKAVMKYQNIISGYWYGAYSPEEDTISWNNGEVWHRAEQLFN